MTDTRSSSALFKRAEQLKRWEESDTNKQSASPKRASRIQFSSGIVFLAACTAGDKDEVQRLLKMGADINTANVDGLTALHQACIDDNLDMVEFLVTHGADVNRGDNEGWTALHATASCGFLSIARYLLENGADVGAVNYDGELAIDIAESDAMENLLQKAIDEKGVDCEKSRNAEVDLLLADAKNWASSGYVEVRDPKTGGTPLHVAAAKGYLDVAKTLLEECNVEPDCVDYEGWTPLHAAALWGQRDTCALLLKHGADAQLTNYSGQTCLDLVDPSISAWLADAAVKTARRLNNNKRRKSPPTQLKRVELQITGQDAQNEKGAERPPKARAPSPSTDDDAPSWRRSASFRRQTDRDASRESNKPANNTAATDNDTILRRTHSFENDKTASERRERDASTWSPGTPTTPATPATPVAPATPTTPTAPAAPQTTVRRSFVPPVRDEESETQRKAHAKRVRETRRSTQGVTLDEIKSAEQLVKKKAGNGVAEPPTAAASPAPAPALAGPAPAPASPAPAPASANKKPDSTTPNENSFELEDASSQPPRAPAASVPPAGTGAATGADATVTLSLRRPPAAPNAANAANAANATNAASNKEDNRTGAGEEERESSAESKTSTSPASTQAAMNVIQRRRRPKRRSTGVGHVDMDDIVNDRGATDVDTEADPAPLSGSERSRGDDAEEGPRDYRALYEASQVEVRRLRALLTTSEQQLRDVRATITCLTQNQSQNSMRLFERQSQSSLSELEKREKRAMERKLSEMEEELKYQQALQAENQRLKDENGALIRVISKLSK